MHRYFAFALLIGCAPARFAYTPASSLPVNPKPDNCAFEVLTAPSGKDFEELGYLEYYNGGEPKTVDKFKEAVGKQVCGAGGDAVVATANPKGELTKGTVIRYVAKLAEPVAPVAPSGADTGSAAGSAAKKK